MYIYISYLFVVCHTFSFGCSLAFVILPVSHISLVEKKKRKKKTKQNKAKEKQKTRLLFSYIIFYISVLVAFYFFGSFLTQTLTPHFPLPPHTYLPPVLRTWDISRHTSETLFLANARRVQFYTRFTRCQVSFPLPSLWHAASCAV